MDFLSWTQTLWGGGGGGGVDFCGSSAYIHGEELDTKSMQPYTLKKVHY